MRKLFITTSIMAALAAGSAMAQGAAESVAIDPDTICEGGCTVVIDFTDKARHADEAIVRAGEFIAAAEENPLAYVAALGKTDTGITVYELSKEPGSPRFHSIAQVKAYIAGQNALIRRIKRLQPQNSGS